MWNCWGKKHYLTVFIFYKLKFVEQSVECFVEEKGSKGRKNGFDCVKGEHDGDLGGDDRFVGYSVKGE